MCVKLSCNFLHPGGGNRISVGSPACADMLCGSTQGSEALGEGVGLQGKWLTIRKQGSTVYREEPACILSTGASQVCRHEAYI